MFRVNQKEHEFFNHLVYNICVINQLLFEWLQVVNEFQQVQKGLNTVKNDLKINASDARKSIQELVASKISELRKKEKVKKTR